MSACKIIVGSFAKKICLSDYVNFVQTARHEYAQHTALNFAAQNQGICFDNSPAFTSHGIENTALKSPWKEAGCNQLYFVGHFVVTILLLS